MTPAVLAEFLLNGLVLGALYVLMALGLSIIFGMIGVINFAHGALFTLGAYVAFQVRDVLGFPGALVVAPALVGILGMLIEAAVSTSRTRSRGCSSPSASRSSSSRASAWSGGSARSSSTSPRP
jgi:branched-subunit amino acid ABC-type transport system permease component